MVRFMSVTQVILRAVLGNIVRMLSVDLFAITECRLVFVEFHETMADAILRENRIKKWRRTWKLELIERHNRQWRDLLRGAGVRGLAPVHARACPWHEQGGRLWVPACAGTTNRVECRTLIFATRY